ncbi:hypothetical protein F0562_029224 [Nyssa sinensis]|uniref:Lon proteolytic domain-containing protein n=1 Tax=Nyssa sinensis TaxID=561372 RepID=A0A5J5B3H3_9ASTE|nr:hypothetical protein F0562_029224 [Nyssa sinensis]
MEIIAIAGYITDEKIHITRDYLETTTREDCGIKHEQVEVTDATLLALIENYCREAGVRNLQKQIEKIYRKIALQLVRKGPSNEHPIARVHVVLSNETTTESLSEFFEAEVGGATQVVAGSVEGSSNEMGSETTEEAETVQSDFPADQIQCPTDQASDSKDTLVTAKIQETEATDTVEKVLVDSSNLSNFVGKPVFHAECIYDQTPIRVVMGLAWTAMGGSTLYIETTQVEEGTGKGALNLTGQLGDVMKQNAQIAHTVARAILHEKELDNPFFANSKLHLHVPVGPTPKDRPSAGCTMVTSLLSLAMKKPVKMDLALTGTLVKEKTIAARRSDVKTIIFPSANRRDFDELAPNVKAGLEVHFVDDYSQIFDLAFGDNQHTEK